MAETNSKCITKENEIKVNPLKEANTKVYNLLKESEDVEKARDELYTYIEELEKELIFGGWEKSHELEKSNAKKCIGVLKNILSPKNEKRTNSSALTLLWQNAHDKKALNECFTQEFTHLFKGVICNSGIYPDEQPEFIDLEGRDAAVARSDILDGIGGQMDSYFEKYKTGLVEDVASRRKENKQRILKYFGGTEDDWNNWDWHLQHVITTSKVLFDLIDLPNEKKKAVEITEKHRVPFGITPYYLSLMDKKESDLDDAIRAQVIPPLDNAEAMASHKSSRSKDFDFMKEHDTSPVDLVTRRYPLVAILKPYNTCPQICVYCQRNWEIDEVLAKGALASQKKIDEAIDWYKDHPVVKEVLITGGDPGIMKDAMLEYVVSELSKIDHIEKIRIASRILVTLPCRVTDKWTDMLAKYHEPGKRELYVVTHFEHPYEITPEAMEAVQRLRKKGFSVYNQEVFTTYNSRRFESVALRRALKSIGIDPYYTFNPKGKKETKDYLVPIARILQERKEEARLLPGSSRTDEPVFNVPGLGKNHLRAMQDHEVIMIKEDGSRIYEMHPWEKNMSKIDPYLYTDIPIADFLAKMKERGDNPADYKSIWYYY